MTLQEASHHLGVSLQQIYDAREAQNIAALVLEKITGLSRAQRLTARDMRFSDDMFTQLEKFCRQLLAHRPVQYVLNEAWFYGLKFYVDERVLIPRPETEELVEWVLNDMHLGASVLDIGTGSGCIPVSIKKKFPAAAVAAFDISLPALEIASRNAVDNGVAVNFFQADLLQAGKDNQQIPKTSIIVSNPPYIPEWERRDMDVHVKDFEPPLALFVPDSDPFLFYKAIGGLAKSHLMPGGAIYVETHADLATGVADVFCRQGFVEITIRKDHQQRDRMVKACIKA